MVITVLVVLAAASAVVLFKAEKSGFQGVIYAAKPLTLVAIGTIAVIAFPVVSESYRKLILVGLVLSLVGDVFLMLPKDRFLAGLAAFLLAHVAYAGAFFGRLAHVPVLPFLPYVVGAAFMLVLLWPHLGAMKPAVVLYVAAILLMAGLSLAVAMETGGLNAWTGAAGALLFVLSDAALAFDRFVGAFDAARFLILGTYFMAQLLIVLSVLA